MVAGAGYTDIHAALPGMRIMMVIGWALGALLIANGFWRRRWRWPLYGIGGWVVALIVVRVIFPALVQSLVVSPNQQAKESPYIAYNIAATRSAYGLDKINQTQYPLTGDLNTAKLVVNSATIRNIRLWDQNTLLTSYGQLQQLRPYYEFTTVGVDRYDVNGVYRETMLAPRELNIAGLPSQSQTWVNQHRPTLTASGPSSRRSTRSPRTARPTSWCRTCRRPRVPPTSKSRSRASTTACSAPTTRWSTPRRPSSTIPTGRSNYHYTGSGGIPINSFFNRLAFSVRFGTIRFFTSNAIDSPAAASSCATTSCRDCTPRRPS